MKKAVVSTISVAALMLAWGSTFGAASAQASPAGPTGCVPETWTEVVQVGAPYYSTIGSAAGKYNPSSVASTLSYALTKTTARATTWQAGATASVSFGIGKVEGNTSFSVTTSTTTGSTVTDTLSVPSHYYGYDQPKVEYRTFHIYDMKVIANCSTVAGTNYGYLNSITAYPFFSACTATSACTPKP